MTPLQIKLLSLPLLAVVYAATLALIVGLRPPRRWLLAVAVVGVIGFAVREVALLYALGFLETSFDFMVFRQMGGAALRGLDSYDPSLGFVQPMLYPPNTPPVMTIFAVLGPRSSYLLWMALSLAAGAALGVLSRRALADPETTDIGPEGATILGLSLVLTPSIVTMFDVGQMALLVTGLLIAALAARQAHRPGLAGLLLALASIKPTLTVPFLVLFNRRTDRTAWAVLVGVTLLLVGITSAGFVRLPLQFERLALELSRGAAPGGINDIGLQNENSEAIIGFDHTLFRLGLEDYRLARISQFVLVVGLGAWLSWEAWRRRYGWGARCALVGAYSPLFFYHRSHDLAILILPMLYASGRARITTGRARVFYAAVSLASLFAMWHPGRFIRWARPASFEWGELAGRAFRAAVLPWSTYGVLLVIVALVLAERRFGAGYDRRETSVLV